MDNINQIVSNNIRRIRQERNLSLDELARLSGVSKSMLAQIERGDGNPSLSTLWKIANGMMVTFNTLVEQPHSPYEIVRLSDIEPVTGEHTGMKNYILFSGDETQRFSIYYIEVEPGYGWQSEKHMHGTVEFITVFSGELRLTVGEEIFHLKQGESIRFKSDTVHAYQNLSSELLVFHNILFNP